MSSKADPTPTSSEPAPGKPKSKLLLVGGGVAIVALLGAGVMFSGVLSKPKKVLPIATEDVRPIYVETPEMVTNLDAGPHRITFAKVQCRIEVARGSDAGALTTAMPRVVDMIQTYLRETRPEELRSDVGTYRLHEALLLRASIAAPAAHVTDVLFEELIVQ